MLRDIGTVFWRDWIVLRRRMAAFLLSRMVAPLLYLVAFGWGLGRGIASPSGGSYLDFLVPGILALNSMNISFNSVVPVHAERIYHKSIEQYIIAPIWPYAFVVGKVLAAVLRGLLSSSVIVVVAWLVGAHVSVTPLLVLVLALNCAVFAGIGFAAAMHIASYEQMGQVNTYILLPMSFLCGTFFSTRALPDALRVFVELLPLTHTSALLRAISAGGAADPVSVAVLAAYLALALWIGGRSFLALRD